MKLYQYGIALILLMAAAYGVGRYVQPAKIETHEVEVIKEVEVVKKDVVTVIKEIVRPDGTKETVTTITDKTKETSKKDSKSESSTVIVYAKPQWRVQSSSSLETNPKFGLGLERRVLGSVFMGIGTTNVKDAFKLENTRITLSYEF